MSDPSLLFFQFCKDPFPLFPQDNSDDKDNYHIDDPEERTDASAIAAGEKRCGTAATAAARATADVSEPPLPSVVTSCGNRMSSGETLASTIIVPLFSDSSFPDAGGALSPSFPDRLSRASLATTNSLISLIVQGHDNPPLLGV